MLRKEELQSLFLRIMCRLFKWGQEGWNASEVNIWEA